MWMPLQIKASSGGAHFYRSLEKLFIRTWLRSQWNRNFSKAGSSRALISLTFSVVISGPRRPPVFHRREQKGAPPKLRLCRATLSPKCSHWTIRDTESCSMCPLVCTTPGTPTVHSTWAGEMQDGSTCGRHAERGNYSSGSCIASNMPEVLNVIYSGSSCWEEALKWVKWLHFTRKNKCYISSLSFLL